MWRRLPPVGLGAALAAAGRATVVRGGIAPKLQVCCIACPGREGALRACSPEAAARLAAAVDEGSAHLLARRQAACVKQEGLATSCHWGRVIGDRSCRQRGALAVQLRYVALWGRQLDQLLG